MTTRIVDKKQQNMKEKIPKNQPISEMSQKERGDYTLAIVEEMREGFKAMGEGFAGMHAELVKVRDRGEATFEEVGRIRVELNGVKDEIVEIKADIVEIKAELVDANDRLTGIEKVLTTKADTRDMYTLGMRVSQLEDRAESAETFEWPRK